MDGGDPRRSAAVNQARGEAISELHRRNRSWAREHPAQRDQAWFKREVATKLDAYSLKEIAAATGLSLAACSRIRAGLKIPHARHWDALLGLVKAGNEAPRRTWPATETFTQHGARQVRIPDFGRYALGICAAALLAGCGGSQPPIGAPLSPSPSGLTDQRTPTGVTFKTLYSFTGRGKLDSTHGDWRREPDRDGRRPDAGLLDVNGTLYGTTYYGGNYGCRFFRSHDGCGAIFTITTSGNESVLYHFYPNTNGEHPQAALTEAGGTLYGTTRFGGSGQDGTVFSITLSGKETVLYNFTGTPDGAYPGTGLAKLGDTFYGATDSGGTDGHGTVFSVTESGVETVLHSFAGAPSDGAAAVSHLTNVGGTLYGTTEFGGTSDHGTVFSITPSGTETVLYSFKGGTTDGSSPHCEVIDVHGTLYGTTLYGGEKGRGTVFKMTRSGAETVIYSFRGAPFDGKLPQGKLINVGGTLYGITYLGGLGRDGTVFSITTSGKETPLHMFRGEDGKEPVGHLVDVNGTLYGVTWAGGSSKDGTVFAITP